MDKTHVAGDTCNFFLKSQLERNILNKWLKRDPINSKHKKEKRKKNKI
jgi:hypothetical protein